MKKLVSLFLALIMLVSVAAVATADEPVTFNVLSGISALSGGYDGNEVLNAMQEQAGVKITWDTWSDSLGEVVGTRISGNAASKTPIDAFQAVGFSNFDLMRYGAAGTFIDLTPYITPEVMPHLSAILIILCVSMQLIGDGLRDAFDPYSRAAGEVADEESKKDEAEKAAAAATGAAAGSDHE